MKKIASVLLALFDSAIQEGLHDRKEIDVIKLMKEFVKKEMKNKEKGVKKIKEELSAINSLSKRISSKDGRNLLGSIITRKKDILESSSVKLTQELRLMKMVIEELENYTCLVEVARTVQMYFVGEMATVDSTSSW